MLEGVLRLALGISMILQKVLQNHLLQILINWRLILIKISRKEQDLVKEGNK